MGYSYSYLRRRLSEARACGILKDKFYGKGAEKLTQLLLALDGDASFDVEALDAWQVISKLRIEKGERGKYTYMNRTGPARQHARYII